jgi:hypothetical protein
MKQIPDTTPVASEDHRLSIFSGDPEASVSPALDDWEDILNPMMKRAFDWGANLENVQAMRGLARRGQNGLDGFHRFVGYFVMHRGLKGALVETKAAVLLAAIDTECVILNLGQLSRNSHYLYI